MHAYDVDTLTSMPLRRAAVVSAMDLAARRKSHLVTGDDDRSAARLLASLNMLLCRETVWARVHSELLVLPDSSCWHDDKIT